MKRVLFLALILIFSRESFRAEYQPQSFDLTQYGVKIEPDKRVIIVMAALEAAGLETPLTAEGDKFRQNLRTDLQSVLIRRNCVEKMSFFVEQYKNRHPNTTDAELDRAFYFDGLLARRPVPDLTDPPRATDLPGDFLEVLDFSPLVREFYRASRLKRNPKMFRCEQD